MEKDDTSGFHLACHPFTNAVGGGVLFPIKRVIFPLKIYLVKPKKQIKTKKTDKNMLKYTTISIIIE